MPMMLQLVHWALAGAMGMSAMGNFAAIAQAPSQPAAGKERIAYAPGPSRFGELRLPAAGGPVPVVVLIHGGCWLASYALGLMDRLADDLRGRGVAVWNIEYRRLGEDGGGYPGTFLDVGAAVDALRTIAARHPIDLGRVVAVGHSAGGHLALWAAARPRLPRGSPLAAAEPQRLAGVLTLAVINDLAAYRAGGPACGGARTIDALIDARNRPGNAAYADTSPPALLPLGVPQIVASGGADAIVPARFGRDYAKAAAAKGDRAEALDLAGADHFALIDPAAPAWTALWPKLQALLR